MHEISLPDHKLYTAAQVRELDRLAIAGGIPGIQLMKCAGKAVLEILLECWSQPEFITVYCGTGNNGGDGYIVAALVRARQIPVRVIQVGDHSQLRGDAKRAHDFAEAQSVEMLPFQSAEILSKGMVVDALLGTGLSGEVRAPFQQAIEQINASALPVVAVDIPSGLSSDTGNVCGTCVTADLTVSFIGLKRGLYTANGPEQCGEIFFEDLDVSPDIYASISSTVEKLELESVLQNLVPRQRTAHKGDFGHVLVIGGDHGYGGAVLMAAESALRCGAGLVSVATHESHVAAMLARQPEIMAHAVENHHTLLPLLTHASVLVVGPGLGQTPWSEQMLYHSVQHAIERDLPVVMDADALNLLAEGRLLKALPKQLILTPHPGEAARLLQILTEAVQQDRFAAAQQLQQKYSATVILKGAGTLVASENRLSLSDYGNPGMATGGMGDVLSGVLGALLAQHLLLSQAAELGVCLHAAAADVLAEENGERGLLATDLASVMRYLMHLHD
jgi:hydroxyethylthiazole kinase-like uncharacterized protein yjeF